MLPIFFIHLSNRFESTPFSGPLRNQSVAAVSYSDSLRQFQRMVTDFESRYLASTISLHRRSTLLGQPEALLRGHWPNGNCTERIGRCIYPLLALPVIQVIRAQTLRELDPPMLIYVVAITFHFNLSSLRWYLHLTCLPLQLQLMSMAFQGHATFMSSMQSKR
jgi:hypothetical protein